MSRNCNVFLRICSKLINLNCDSNNQQGLRVQAPVTKKEKKQSANEKCFLFMKMEFAREIKPVSCLKMGAFTASASRACDYQKVKLGPSMSVCLSECLCLSPYLCLWFCLCLCTICFISICTPLGRHNSLQNQPILKVKKRPKTRAQELSSASKLVSVAQTVKKCQ